MEGVQRKGIVTIVGVLLYASVVGSASAQIGGYGIPSTYLVSGEDVVSGDIISFDPKLNIYSPSFIPRDQKMFGVVDINPIVVFRSESDRLPLIQIGELFVNVTTVNGNIFIGDEITTSPIPGKGQKFLEGGDGYILGIALESLSENENNNKSTSTIVVSNGEFASGSIRVLLAIGPASNSPNNKKNTSVSPATIFVRENTDGETGLETIFRYITATLFTLGTIFVVLKTFGPNIGRGIVSVGRNPLAKTGIQAMVVFNVILILAITAVAFIVSLLIIFLPI